MKPKLEAMSGPLRGTSVALVDEEISIGRDRRNLIRLDSMSVSRRHCSIRSEGGRLKICDLESRNGTFVNGIPVKERFLDHGDQIRVGDSLFLVLLREGEEPLASNPVELRDQEMTAGATVELSPEEALTLRKGSAGSVRPVQDRIAHDLGALLKIGTAVSSIRSVRELERHLLEMIFEVVPAERGAILLVGRSPEDFASVFGWHKGSGPDRSVQVSRTIVRRALERGVAILSNEVLDGGDFKGARSLVSARVRSVMVVPLIVLEKKLGVIYLDSSKPGDRFDEGHLELLTAISGIAAVALENAGRMEWLEKENLRLQADIGIEHNMVGESPRMGEIYRLIARVAPTDSTVLICGESGTGKELAARAIHRNSPRAAKPFVGFNCAALTDTLLESELFGHEKGAFTGATAQTKGRLEVADGGTVFLDEIGEMAPVLQVKLLRVLQEKQFERVGGTRPIKVDIRLVAATSRDLKTAISTGAFREDLYYRLNVVTLTMPPLRERREDIPLLATYFAAKSSAKCKRRIAGISAKARERLIDYDWPGNVRELENAIERAVVLGSGEEILPEDLPEAVLEPQPRSGAPSARYHEAIRETKKKIILKAVKETAGNYVEAAKLLDVHPNYLHRLIRNMNLKATLKR
jgi:transcriptional regulator with GAF, ATPase, and Fis domain